MDAVAGRWMVTAAMLSAVLALATAPAQAAPTTSVSLVDGFELRLDGAAARDEAGVSTADAGDVNGDGLHDVVVGASGASANTGAAFVVYGAAGGRGAMDLPPPGTAPAPSEGFRIVGGASMDYFGYQVAGAGDVNGDGFDDLIVGSVAADPVGQPGAGSAYVIYGAATNPGTIQLPGPNGDVAAGVGYRVNGAAADDQAAVSLDGAGDVNGDGFDDVIVGARGADPGGRGSAGSTFVIYGSATNPGSITVPVSDGALSAAQGYRIDGAGSGDEAGNNVAGAGDVNGDGLDDVIVGAYGTKPGENSTQLTGSAYVLYGARVNPGTVRLPDFDTPLTAERGFRVNGAAPYDAVGIQVSGTGDVNGDGFDDVTVTSRRGRVGFAQSVYVFYGAAGNPGTIVLPVGDDPVREDQGFRIDAPGAGDYLRGDARAVADVNGDGTDDVIVGAPGANPGGRTRAGSVFVIYGTKSRRGTFTLPALDGPLVATEGFRADGAAPGDRAGGSTSGWDDINGDGHDDVLVGASGAAPGARTGAGSVYLVDTTAPPAPAITAPSAGTITTSGFTVSGTGEAGSTVELFDGATPLSTTAVAADGKWSKDLTGVADGSHSYSADATDKWGNRSQPSGPVAVTVDTRPTADPAPRTPSSTNLRDTVAPVITAATLSSARFSVDSGARASARTKRGTRLTVRLSEPATVILVTEQRVGRRWRRVRIFGQRLPAGRTTIDYSGKIKPRGKHRALRPGRYRLRMRPSDRAGNKGKVTTIGFTILKR